ncbi:hypothetical protein ONE63_000039 [Megalurothrips usitatus]|uniref:THAP-type domain-containing protein n=1 Tax=Megalurothrips usitatus TaxID=439358 RepID=A0AAV7XX86_9NEOP|nr:hypothetical protein ONE63_000039 [Megalurothrips usitatus]
MLEEWERRISRGGGWKMKATDTVCELHFEKKFVKERHLNEVFIGNIDLSHKRDKKTLTDDAVPSIFDGYPSYKNFKEPSKRKCPNERSSAPPPQKKKHKRVDHDIGNMETFMPEALQEAEPQQEHIEEILCNYPVSFAETVFMEPNAIKRPNANWHVHKGHEFVSFVCIDSTGTQIDRFVKLTKGHDGIHIALIQRRILTDEVVQSYEEPSHLLERVDQLIACPGIGTEDGKRSDKCCIFIEAGGVKRRIPPRCRTCAERKKSIAKGIRRDLVKRYTQARNKKEKNNKIRSLAKQVISRNKKITKLKEKIEDLQNKCALLDDTKVREYVKCMPPCWQNAILACVQASKATSSNGRRYTTNWIYECQLLRIKSLACYKKMLRDNFLPLPSLRTLQRYMKKLAPAYGFQTNIFDVLREKVSLMTEAQKHGAILIDEIKLSEGLWFDKHSLKLLGFVNLDQFTPEGQKDVPADHALVMMFQGFQGQYFQTVSAHLSRGAVKGGELAKLTLEAVRLLEDAGLFVDVVVADAAPWNRNMWAQFGLKKLSYERENSKKKYSVDDEDNDEDYENFEYELVHASVNNNTTQGKKKTHPRRKKETARKKQVPSNEAGPGDSVASCIHPVDSNRRLWFVSDFPHLVKSMKQRVINAEELETPDGKVKLNHWAIVIKEDEKKGIKVAPKLSTDHLQTDTYAAMSVGKSFSFFSEEAATAMEHYRRLGVRGMEDCESTVKFIRRVNVLIDALNSNSPQEGLKAPQEDQTIIVEPPVCPACGVVHGENTPQRKKPAREVLEDFLEYLEKWETSGVTREKRLTASAAYGLRITINTALELSMYLITNLGYEYLMTRRINQDKLEHFFGEIRQGCGAHGHPDPSQFIQVYRLMCFKTLVKPPRGSNVTGGDMLESLLALPDHRSVENKRRQIELGKELDEALDTGEEVAGPFSDHTYYESLTVDPGAIKMFGGYVARKARRTSYAKECSTCFECLKAPWDQALREEEDDIIHSRSKGYLLTPSDSLMLILKKLELCVLEVFQMSHLHADIVFEVTNQVKMKAFEEVGCDEHKRKLTKAIISFYLCTRLIFACEEYNKHLSLNAKKKQKAKQQQKMFRLTC